MSLKKEKILSYERRLEVMSKNKKAGNRKDNNENNDSSISSSEKVPILWIRVKTTGLMLKQYF